MLQKMGRYLGIFAMLIIAILVLAWATSPDPKLNPASFEAEPLTAAIAPLDEAITLAQYKGSNGETITLQVLEFTGETVTGVELAELGAKQSDDPFATLASASSAPITAATIRNYPTIDIAIADLLSSGTNGAQHIGTGTNFPEHAEESNSQSVFQFPKFGQATPARTQVQAKEGVLLDYEVETCMRFDRDIASPADFDAAVKGLFLCGDFTNRNALVDLADPDNLDSGYGFSDAKSGPDSYPTGPFLVIPKDWPAFTKKLRMTTSVNGQPRQDARGEEMTLDFRQLAEKALGDMSQPRFLYKDAFHLLAKDKRISISSTLMSGTAEGVIFTPPTRRDIIEGMVHYVSLGGPLSDTAFLDAVRGTFIDNEIDSGHFLQPGDLVRHDSNFLGDIEVQVVAPKS
ncbi:fumarylacetoacetate hydrolase family protein [Parasphingorhabdus sp.]|jgi:2-keto-4-pentenoate hydratase/2-oxohepta-3-ene-1,7-dioic acid hydratase in catechol pathway|uniref:fumarylacetoacetate hydrolase family protein n=1 Tax=Parasphingorhabdus sp. TaxID=2709688 RepID=UPI0030A98393